MSPGLRRHNADMTHGPFDFTMNIFVTRDTSLVRATCVALFAVQRDDENLPMCFRNMHCSSAPCERAFNAHDRRFDWRHSLART